MVTRAQAYPQSSGPLFCYSGSWDGPFDLDTRNPFAIGLHGMGNDCAGEGTGGQSRRATTSQPGCLCHQSKIVVPSSNESDTIERDSGTVGAGLWRLPSQGWDGPGERGASDVSGVTRASRPSGGARG